MQKQPPWVFYKKGVLKNLQTLQENTCPRVSFLIKLENITPSVQNVINIINPYRKTHTSENLHRGTFKEQLMLDISPKIVGIIFKPESDVFSFDFG